MPIQTALRLKKLMHDVGDIEPESLFLSVAYDGSPGVWRLGFKQHIMLQEEVLQATVAQLERWARTAQPNRGFEA